MDPALTALIGAATAVLVEVARLMRETRLRRSGRKRTRDVDQSEG